MALERKQCPDHPPCLRALPTSRLKEFADLAELTGGQPHDVQ